MVREGAFKYSSNAMYMFVFLGLWGVALIFRMASYPDELGPGLVGFSY